MTPIASKSRDLAGRRFGYLVAMERRRCGGKSAWLCRCDCGKEAVVLADNLWRGQSKSCGCRRYELMSHTRGDRGVAKTRIYKIWKAMRRRCENPNAKSYSRYGGRGITVCERWRKFENFLADMGEMPPGRSIDRINNAGNYEPGNCRWATAQEQGRNKRTNLIVTAFGESKTATDWSDDPRCTCRMGTLWRRLKKGWPPERAITEPVKPWRGARLDANEEEV